MRLKYGVAIAGAHGKTTTTSMVATVLAAGRHRPHGGHRREAEQHRHQCQAGPGRVPGGRGRRERRQLSEAFARPSPWSRPSTRSTSTTTRTSTRSRTPSSRSSTRCPSTGSSILCLDQPHIQALIPQVAEAVPDLRHEHPGGLPGQGGVAQAAGLPVQGRPPRPGPGLVRAVRARACTTSTTAWRPSPWRGSWRSTSR